MYNKNIKPIYNYDLQECNLLFKKGIHPIGCGVGDKDGRVFHVFMADRRYFDAVRLIQYEIPAYTLTTYRPPRQDCCHDLQ